jgi:hypothetical protein
MKILVFRSEHNALSYKIINTFYYRSKHGIFSL